MKKSLLVVIAAVLLLSLTAVAQNPSSTGTLKVNAVVDSSIQMTFVTDPNGVTLGGDGTNDAVLNFGNVSAFGSLATNVTRPSVTATDFTVKTNFGVNVVSANSASANYQLLAALPSNISGFSYTVDSTPVTSTLTLMKDNNGYGTTSHSISVKIPRDSATKGAYSDTINFTATAN